MNQIAESLLALLGKDESVLREKVLQKSGTAEVYISSIHTCGKAAVFMCRDEEKKYLLLDVAAVGENGEVGEYENASSWFLQALKSKI